MSVEQRDLRSDEQRRAHQALRAEHVIQAYLAAHPDQLLRQKVEQGSISITEAYRLLKDFARDPKTNVLRSDLLRYSLDYELYNSRATGEPITVAIFDIDDFKRINTELTHVGADEILKKIAAIITREIRQSDDVLSPGDDEAVVRWGGEEFVVLFSGADATASHVAAERIRERITTELTDVRPHHLPVTVSGGLAEYYGESNGDWQDLLKQADRWLLAAKENGKNVIYPLRPQTIDS